MFLLAHLDCFSSHSSQLMKCPSLLQGIPLTSQWYSWLKSPSVLINAWTVFSHAIQNLRIGTESWRQTLTVRWMTSEHIQQLSKGPNTIKSQGRIDFFSLQSILVCFF